MLPGVPSYCVHVVAVGETLFRIALSHNMTVGDFTSVNNLPSADQLLIGDILIIPYEDCRPYARLKG